MLEIARSTGLSRFTIGRWLKGQAEPRLPDFLCLIDALSLRLLDFVSGLVDPAQLPSVSTAWHRLEAARRTAYDAPWSHAVLHAIELEAYRRLPKHVPGWIAKRVGLTRQQEEQSLELLRKAGQIRRQRGRFQVVQSQLVDTRPHPEGPGVCANSGRSRRWIT